MNKKELNYLLMKLEIFKSEQLNTDSKIEDDTHFTDSFDKTNEIITNELNEHDVQIALMAKQTEYLKSIKNMVFFFAITFAVSLIFTLLLILKNFT